ncbi:diguanylate cyclase [Leptospira ryugenii]|nr:diguanylate cyclase [Leptospira ryugenii]
MALAHILIIEDSEIEARLLERWLRKHRYETTIALNVKEARDQIGEKEIDVVLMDWSLPDGEGIDLIKELMDSSPSGWLPIIMITSHQESSKVKEAFEAGATDFMRKPADEIELLARIYGALRIKGLQELLLETSIRDPLTNLYNRRYMDDRVTQEFFRCKRHGHPFSICLLDIDHFKHVNDTYGHDMGDSVLRCIATILKNHLRQTDVVARYGGEEYLILLPETNLQNALLVMEKIRNLVASHKQVTEDNREFFITFSGGISGGQIQTNDSVFQYMREADRLLYVAKESGRNKVLVQDKN